MLARIKRRADQITVNGSSGGADASVIPLATALNPEEEQGVSATTSSIPPSEVGESPKEKAALEWTRGADDYVILSKCGRYKIRKEIDQPATQHNDAVWKYRCLRITSTWEFDIGCYANPTLARRRCVESLESKI